MSRGLSHAFDNPKPLARSTERRLASLREKLLAIAADWEDIDCVIGSELCKLADGARDLSETIEDVYPKGQQRAPE